MITFPIQIQPGPDKSGVVRRFRLFSVLVLLAHLSLEFVVDPPLVALKVCAVFLTFWGLFLAIFFFIIGTVSPANPILPILLHVNLLAQLIITSIFWGGLWPLVSHKTGLDLYISITYHSVPFGLLLIELVIGDVELIEESWNWFVGFFFSYVGWNMVIVLGFEVIVYPPFTWRNLGTYLTMVVTLLFSRIAWNITFAFQRFKLKGKNPPTPRPLSPSTPQPINF